MQSHTTSTFYQIDFSQQKAYKVLCYISYKTHNVACCLPTLNNVLQRDATSVNAGFASNVHNCVLGEFNLTQKCYNCKCRGITYLNVL